MVLARSYEASSWTRLVQSVRLVDAIWRDDLTGVRKLVTDNPNLIHEDALIRKDGNWGRRFHAPIFVSQPAMRLIEEAGGVD